MQTILAIVAIVASCFLWGKYHGIALLIFGIIWTGGGIVAIAGRHITTRIMGNKREYVGGQAVMYGLFLILVGASVSMLAVRILQGTS